MAYLAEFSRQNLSATLYTTVTKGGGNGQGACGLDPSRAIGAVVVLPWGDGKTSPSGQKRNNSPDTFAGFSADLVSLPNPGIYHKKLPCRAQRGGHLR